MKIAFLLLSIERSGGVRVTTEIINQLSDLGHECLLLVPDQNEFPFEIRDKVKIVRVNESMRNRKLAIIHSVFSLAYEIPKDIDIIVSSYYLTAYSALLAKLRIPKSKLFYIVQGYEPNYFRHENGKTQWGSYFLAKLSYLLPLKRSAISHWLANLINLKGYKQIPVINNGIDSKVFIPLQDRTNKKNKVIMTVANKRSNRGFFDFCKSANQLWSKRKDFSVLIIGNDKDIVFKLDAPYSFITPKNDNELVSAYQQSSIFVTCSHEEGFGLTPLEAMACGTPVVCTDSGGINDYAKNEENCIMVPVKNIVRIANAIDLLLNDNKLRDKFIKNGSQTAMNFDWKIIGLKYHNFFSGK